MAAVLQRSPNDRGSATHPQRPLLGDFPKFPLVSMECGCRGSPSDDGRIPSTQALREPATNVASDVANESRSPRDLAVCPVHWPRLPGILALATGVLRKLLRWPRRRRFLGRAVPEMAQGRPPFAVVWENVRARGSPGVVERLLEALCETRMETPATAPVGLACQSLLMRDDGGGLRHPFQHGGSRPTSTSELTHRISEVVSKADRAMLRKDSIDFGFISSHAASRVTRKAFVSYIEIPVQIPRRF